MKKIDPITHSVLLSLEEKTGYKPEYDPEKRAALIEAENADPEIKARKEQKIQSLIDLWVKAGIIKLTEA